jgi:hypothetical protein
VAAADGEWQVKCGWGGRSLGSMQTLRSCGVPPLNKAVAALLVALEASWCSIYAAAGLGLLFQLKQHPTESSPGHHHHNNILQNSHLEKTVSLRNIYSFGRSAQPVTCDYVPGA